MCMNKKGKLSTNFSNCELNQIYNWVDIVAIVDVASGFSKTDAILYSIRCLDKLATCCQNTNILLFVGKEKWNSNFLFSMHIKTDIANLNWLRTTCW